MFLEEAELFNFCQHRYTKVRFGPGLTAVVGRNGSGKSNLMKAIYAAVTGDFGRNDGVKTDNICQGVGPTAVSKINVTLSHAGTTLDITRGIRPATTRLMISGQQEPITKTSEVNDAIAAILGVSPRILSDYVFVDQWSIFDFLSMMPAERAKAFQRLFRTEQAEAIWRTLGDHQDKIVIPMPGVSKDAVQTRLAADRAARSSIKTALDGLLGVLGRLDAEDDRRIVSDRRRYVALLREHRDLCERLDVLTGELSESDEEIRDYESNLRDLNDFISSIECAAAEAKRSLDLWSTTEALAKTRATLTGELLAAHKEVDNLTEPTPPEDYIHDSDVDWWDEYKKLTDRVTSAGHFMSLLKEDHPHCPTCGTPKDDLADHRAEYECRVAEDRVRHAAMNEQIDRSRQYDSDVLAHGRRVNALNKQISSLTSQLAAQPQLTMPTVPKEQLEATVREFQEYETTRNRVEREYNSFKMNRQHQLGQQKQLLKECDKKAEELEAVKVTEDEALAAERRLDTHEKLLREKIELSTKLEIIERSIKSDEDSLAELLAIERHAAGMQAWSNYAGDMRHIVHRDNLPKIVAQNNLELMEDEINDLLMKFDAPYRVKTDENLSFTAQFKDGRNVPAARLSGGEKVLLALAFRVTVNDVFAKDLGLLCLDEPTAGLDEANLACIKIAIERLKELSACRGLQVIMITHEHGLSHLFDNVIEVGKEY